MVQKLLAQSQLVLNSCLDQLSLNHSEINVQWFQDGRIKIVLIFRDNGDSVLHLIAGLNVASHNEETLDAMSKVAEKVISKGININSQNKSGL